MRRHFTLFLFLFSTSVFSQWTTLNIPSAGRYDDVFFINESVGWAAGGNSGRIYKTTNGGANWTMQYNTGDYLRSIEFVNPLVGFCGSLEASLFKTTDGGLTWTNIAPSISPVPPGICGLAAPSENIIYGCGIWSEPAFVIKSVDGGNTWNTSNLSQYASALVDIFFLSEDTGFVVGKANPVTNGGVILYTVNGGETWEVKHQTMANEDYVWKIQTPDSVHFYGSLDALPSTGNVRIVKSDDGGASWVTDTIRNTYQYTQTIGFMDSLHGWCGGLGTLFETTDGGINWEPVSVGNAYNRFFRINETTAFLTGDKIYKYNGGIPTFTVTSGGVAEAHGLHVAPNPVNDNIKVIADIRNKTYCKLQLYAADGKLLQTLHEGPIEKGECRFNVNGMHLGPQILYLVLKTNEELVYRKLVKN
jgi:photosystem II stability/assembly factor-like uncharacterized protein